jgi:protein TonB
MAPRRDSSEPSLADRLKARLQETAAPEESVAVAPEEPPESPDSSTEIEAADFPFAWYLNVLRNRITDVWDPPADRMVAGGRNWILVRFRIHRDGRVTDIVVEGASGTPGLDASARRAVQQARPFPVLPDAYEESHLDVGVRFTVAGGER